MPNKWIEFVKSWSAKNNMSYSDAIKSKECKDAYKAKMPEVSMDGNLSKACWKGYEAIGMKKKGKKLVPNCVPSTDI